MRLAPSMQHNSHRLGPFPQSREDGVMGGLNFEQPSARENPSPSKKAGPPANGKKTKGRVKIKMEFIDNKLRRYTTFSKRKTGIMKKAYELSTLTGTQVMLLVASETGHVYTFATRKLQPMITSEAGKALIQTCLNSPDPPPGPGASGLDQRMSATGFEETDLTYSVGDDCEKVLDTVRPPDSPLLTPSAPATPPAVTLASSVTNAGFAAILAPGNMVIPAQGLGSGAGTVVYHQSSTTASPGLVYASGPSALSEGLILNLGHEQHGGTPQQFITIPVSLSLTPAQQQQLMQGTQTMASTPSCTEMNLPHSQPKREKLRK